MAIADQIERVTRELWRVNQSLGWDQRLGPDERPAVGRLAKAAGATPGQVRAWLDGEVQPTTQQALAIMDALPYPATGPLAVAHRLNGAAR